MGALSGASLGVLLSLLLGLLLGDEGIDNEVVQLGAKIEVTALRDQMHPVSEHDDNGFTLEIDPNRSSGKAKMTNRVLREQLARRGPTRRR